MEIKGIMILSSNGKIVFNQTMFIEGCEEFKTFFNIGSNHFTAIIYFKFK